MRVRLYEVGSCSVGIVLRFDEFPIRLGVGAEGDVRVDDAASEPACLIEQKEGQLVLSACNSPFAPLVNEAALLHGPLMPGDRLVLGTRQFVVSYERTSIADPPPARYRIQPLMPETAPAGAPGS